MSISSLHANSNGRRLAFFDGPVLSSADHPWAGYHLEEAHGPAEAMPSHSWSKTTLLCVTDSGGGSLNWKHRGIWRTDRMQYRTVSVIRRDVEIQSAVPSHSMKTMVLQLDHSKLQHIAPDNVLTIDKTLDTVRVTSDQRLATLMSLMCDEVGEGCPSGRLFAESLSLALLAYLACRYATAQHADHHQTSLSPSQKRVLIDYIRSNAASNISVTELAGLVHMSPSHFTRVFKAAYGMTPYRFVMQERIEGAKEMLASTKLSASQISSAYGFSSQSHFTKVFRQFVGIGPTQYQRGL